MQRPASVWQIAFQHHLSLHSVATATKEMYALPLGSNAALRRLHHSIAKAGSTNFSCCTVALHVDTDEEFSRLSNLKTPLADLS